jgi:transcriptional regulator with XRE-family HTH domain
VPKYEFSPERFCEALDACEKTRADIARLEGCSDSLLTFYCLGYRQPPPHRLVSLAAILDVPVESLFVEVDDDAPVPGLSAVRLAESVPEPGAGGPMSVAPLPLRAILDRADGVDDARARDDRVRVLRECLDDALGEHAHKATVTVEEYARLLGISRSAGFEAVRRGDVVSLRIGRRVVIPVPALFAQFLGVASDPDATTAALDQGDRCLNRPRSASSRVERARA